MTLNLGVGITVLGAVAVGTIGRNDSDVVTGVFSISQSGEDQLVVIVGVQAGVRITDADVVRILPIFVDVRTTDPLESCKVVAIIVIELAIVDTDGCVVVWIVYVINLLQLRNDGA